MATASADVECRKQWELEKRDSRKAECREKTGRWEPSLQSLIPYAVTSWLRKHLQYPRSAKFLFSSSLDTYTVANILVL